MIKRQIIGFVIRLAASSLGIWLCYRFILGATEENLVFYAIAGLIFSVLNTIIRPLLTTLTLPLSILTLGLSTVVINIAIVVLTFWLIHAPEMNLKNLALSSALMILLNGLVNFLVLPYTKK